MFFLHVRIICQAGVKPLIIRPSANEPENHGREHQAQRGLRPPRALRKPRLRRSRRGAAGAPRAAAFPGVFAASSPQSELRGRRRRQHLPRGTPGPHAAGGTQAAPRGGHVGGPWGPASSPPEQVFKARVDGSENQRTPASRPSARGPCRDHGACSVSRCSQRPSAVPRTDGRTRRASCERAGSTAPRKPARCGRRSVSPAPAAAPPSARTALTNGRCGPCTRLPPRPRGSLLRLHRADGHGRSEVAAPGDRRALPRLVHPERRAPHHDFKGKYRVTVGKEPVENT